MPLSNANLPTSQWVGDKMGLVPKLGTVNNYLYLSYNNGLRPLLVDLPRLKAIAASPEYTADIRQVIFALFSAMFNAWSEKSNTLPVAQKSSSVEFSRITKEIDSSTQEITFKLRFKMNFVGPQLLEEDSPNPAEVATLLSTKNIFGQPHQQPVPPWFLEPSVYLGSRAYVWDQLSQA